MNTTLLPCPFCAEPDAEFQWGYFLASEMQITVDYVYVRCGHCGARSNSSAVGFDGNRPECIDTVRRDWNLRRTEPLAPPH